jgi:tetratricopeptide (TPR) repeat protein
MDAVIALDWEQIPDLSINSNPPQGCRERQIELLSSIPVLKRISTYNFIHGGTTEDGQTALVFLEINHRNDLSLVLSLRNKTWLVRQVILGSPKDFFLQNERYRAIAECLAKPDDARAWDLLQEALRIYPDSADLFYYRSLYWQLVKETGKAKVDFFNSICLDNGFVPSYYHLALLNASDREYDEAILWFELLDKLQPNDPQNLNNLAACYAQTGQKAKAKTLWETALSIQPGFEAAKLNLEKLSAL